MKTVTSADYTVAMKLTPPYYERFVKNVWKNDPKYKDKPRAFAFKEFL